MSDNRTRDRFGGPEEKICYDLSQWFDSQDCGVFWDKNPSDGDGNKILDDTPFQTFDKDGQRPDLIVFGDDITVCVEVKDASNTQNVHSGIPQLHKYWREYAAGDAEYRANGFPVDIDAFVLASQYSVEGAVYSRWFDDGVRDWPAEKRYGWINGTVRFAPDYEFSATETATRILWRYAKNDLLPEQPGETIDGEPDAAGIGVLASSYLDTDGEPRRPDPDADSLPPRRISDNFEPYVFYKRPIAHEQKCENWRMVA